MKNKKTNANSTLAADEQIMNIDVVELDNVTGGCACGGACPSGATGAAVPTGALPPSDLRARFGRR